MEVSSSNDTPMSSGKIESFTIRIYFQLLQFPRENQGYIPYFEEKRFRKYPKAPQGSSPQNVINPKLTRIFLTDVVSKPDVKPWNIVTLPNDNVWIICLDPMAKASQLWWKVERSLD